MRQQDGELVGLLVERIGGAGDGIARWRGEPVFLPFTAPGDRVRARLGARRGGGHAGRVVELLVSGAGRALPPCRHFGRCGGCALQHLDADFYRRVKLDRLRAALERARIDPALVGGLRSVAPARRRVRLGLARSGDPRQPVQVGFRQRFRHDLVDIRDCPVLEPALFALVAELRRLAPELLAPGTAAAAALTRTDSGIDVLLEMPQPPALGALEALAGLAEECDLARIVWRSPADEALIVERRPVRAVLSGISVPFPPGAFMQASEAAEAILVEEVLAGVGPRRPVLDLFAGLGVFAFAMATAVARGSVHAVEGDAQAAAALACAAAGVPGMTVERRDLARDPLPPPRIARFAAAVFDPPRAGAARQAAALAASALDAVVAISCNPATFARDAAQLIAGGFRLERLTPIDQFVWTPHLEIVAVFRR